MTSPTASAQLHLFASGGDLSLFLRARLQDAQDSGESVLYLAPSQQVARERTLELASVSPVLDPPITTLSDLVGRLGRAEGEEENPPPPPRLLDLFFQDALALTDPQLDVGAGLAASARLSMQRLLDDGWTPQTFSAAVQRLGGRFPALAKLARWWGLVDGWCSESDGAAPFRVALERGLIARAGLQVLLVELGGLSGSLEARVLTQLVNGVLSDGGRVLVGAVETRTPGGRLARALNFARSLLPGAEVVRHGTMTAGFRPAVDQVVMLEGARDVDTAELMASEVEALLSSAQDPDALLEVGVVVCCPSQQDRLRAEAALREGGIPVAGTHRRPFSAHPGGVYLLRMTELLESGPSTSVEVVVELITGGGWPFSVSERDELVREIRSGGALTAEDVVRLGGVRKTAGGEALRTILNGLFTVSRSMSRADPRAFGDLFRGAVSGAGTKLEQAAQDRGPFESGVDPRRSLWERHGAAAATAGHDLTPDVVAASGVARPVRKLDDLIRLLEERGMRSGWRPTLSQWLRALRALMHDTPLQLGSSPPRGVRIQGIGPTEPAAVVFIMGLIQGRLPRSPRHDPFLRDDGLQALGGDDLALLRLRAHGPDEEREDFLLTMGAARSRLYLCTARMDDTGRGLVPSFFLSDVATALGFSKPEEMLRKERRLDELPPEPSDAGPFPDWRATIRGREESQWLREKSSRLSSSQLTRYGECAFKHLVDSRLQPGDLQPPLLDAAKQGSLIHEWLRRFGHELDGWDHLEAALAGLPVDPPSVPASRYGTPRSQEAWRGARSTLDEFLRWEVERLSASGLRPRYHELAFGLGLGRDHDPASLPGPASLPVGDREVGFAGSIDRVDILSSEKESPIRALAVDYKTGNVREFRKALESGQEIQLPLYLKILERGFGLEPVGALYLSIRHRDMAGFVRADFAHAMGDMTRNVLVLDVGEWEALRARADQEVERLYRAMVEPRILARPRGWDCGYCQLGGLCRIDLWRAKIHD